MTLPTMWHYCAAQGWQPGDAGQCEYRDAHVVRLEQTDRARKIASEKKWWGER